MKYYVIITAGGVGRRMGAKLPKQFLKLGGKPILQRTIELFISFPHQPQVVEYARENGMEFEMEILLVLPPSHIEIWKDYYNSHNLMFPHTIVGGGLTRFHSVRAALDAVPDNAVVAVHDGVRPIVPSDLLLELLTYPLSEKCAGVVPALRVFDSMRKKSYSETGQLTATAPVSREDFILVQTPQVFDSTRLKLAYKKPYSPAFTDDATVLENSGYKFDIIDGSRFNLKITTPDDLKFAQLLIDEE